MDPLVVLREYVSNKMLDKVVVDGDRINFGDQYSFSKAQPTPFRSQGELLPLITVLIFIRHITDGPAQYVQKCTANGVRPVYVQDRKVCLYTASTV